MKKIFILSTLLLLICAPFHLEAQGQGRSVSGFVTDDSGDALVGVTVTIPGTSTVAITNFEGAFVIGIPNEDAVLRFSYVGYRTEDVAVSGRNELAVVLNPDASLLDDVVVIGYGVQQKKLVTGATVQVKGEDIAKLNTVSALGAISSRTPGVNITQASGMPGEEGYKVIIRGLGTASRRGAGPLYVIDGVPGGDINNLNPSDIESIDVLKDAASAAIYGSRAANGVILVTTKHGRANTEAQVSLDGYYGWQNVYRMPQLLNAQEYAVIQNEARMNNGGAPYDFEALVPRWADIQDGSWKGTNWLEESRNRNAPTQNYTLNITGGTEQSIYSIGLGYTSQEGVFGKPRQPQMQRYTARINSEYTLIKGRSFDIVKFGENLTYSYRETQGRIGNGDRWSNTIYTLMRTSPFLHMYDEGDEYSMPIPWNSTQSNPIGVMANRTISRNKSHSLRGNLYLNVQPVKNLNFRSSFGYSYSGSSSRSYSPEYDLGALSRLEIDNIGQDMSSGISLTWENTVTYNFDINDDHNFTALLGQSIEKSGMGEGLEANREDSRFNDFEHAYISNATSETFNANTWMRGSPWGMHRLSSFFGRVSYDYKNKYMATVVLRADGSSNFMRGHRWGYFPSVSAGWVMTEEPWMENNGWLSFLKLRASWGQNGNQDINAFQYLSPINTGGRYIFGTDKGTTSTAAYPSILPNREVSWETSEQFDVGLDATFFNSRLNVAFDYYIKNTKDWLVEAPQLASFGTGAPWVNGGDVRNTGAELSLEWSDRVGDFQYSVGANAAYNKNKVLSIANANGFIAGPTSFIYQPHDAMFRAQEGFPIGYFYGYKTAGIFQTVEEIENYEGAKLTGANAPVPGDVIWVDTDKNGIINSDDMTMIGNPHPDVRLGVNLSASWKGIDLNVVLTGAFGHQIVRSWRSWGDSPYDNYTAEIMGRWHGEGTSDRIPRVSHNSGHPNTQYISDLYVEDGDYLRAQNITLGYDFKSLMPSVNWLGQLRVYVTAQNLFTITGYSGMDPEVGFNPGDYPWASGIDVGFYPVPRTWIVGVNMKF